MITTKALIMKTPRKRKRSQQRISSVRSAREVLPSAKSTQGTSARPAIREWSSWEILSKMTMRGMSSWSNCLKKPIFSFQPTNTCLFLNTSLKQNAIKNSSEKFEHHTSEDRSGNFSRWMARHLRTTKEGRQSCGTGAQHAGESMCDITQDSFALSATGEWRERELFLMGKRVPSNKIRID